MDVSGQLSHERNALSIDKNDAQDGKYNPKPYQHFPKRNHLHAPENHLFSLDPFGNPLPQFRTRYLVQIVSTSEIGRASARWPFPTMVSA